MNLTQQPIYQRLCICVISFYIWKIHQWELVFGYGIDGANKPSFGVNIGHNHDK